MKIQIKPVSINVCWQGKRFKTKAYTAYEKEMSYLLPPKLAIPKVKITMRITFGLSSKNADIDNCVKPLLDILQKKYDFNDKKIYKLLIDKEDVKKGEEYISFKIKKYERKRISHI